MEAKSLLFMSEFVKLSVLCGKVMKTIYGHVVSFLRFRVLCPIYSVPGVCGCYVGPLG